MGSDDHRHEGLEIQLLIEKVRSVGPQIKAAGTSGTPGMGMPITDPLKFFALISETSKATAVVQVTQEV